MKKTYLLTLAALALAFSCQKNSDINDKTEVTPEPVMRTVTCTIANPGPDSKVAINATTGKTEWEVDDEILFHGKYTGVHNELNYSVVVKLTAENISEDKKSFTAIIPAFENAADQAKWEEYGSKSNIIAAYPASAVAVHYGDNWYYQNKFNATNLPLMSGFNDDYDSNHFTFYNLTGILSFVVTGDIDSYTLAGNNSEAVAYSDYASRIYKKTSGNIQKDWVYAGTPITSVSGTITPGAETRIFIPGGVTFSGGFTITFSNGGTPVKTLSTTKEVIIPRNSYRPMGNVTSYLKDYVAPTNHDNTIGVNVATATDLSAVKTANCYIIDGSVAANAGASFKFKAAKGKDGDILSSIGGDEDNDIVVLWETTNTNVAPSKGDIIAAVDYDKQDGKDAYIVFKMPATITPGNALIAAKNAAGKILWSWHIWVPATEIATNDYGISTPEMMDRYLGALEAAATNAPATAANIGCAYEWGRKDPFPGPESFGSSVGAAVSGTSITASSTKISIAESILNPTVMVVVNGKDWNSTSDNTLWNNSGTKSIYDPCPVGYKVPSLSDCPNFYVSDLSTIPGWSIDGTTNHIFTIGSPATAFPLCGYTDEANGTYSFSYPNTRVSIWSADASSDNSGNNIDVRVGDRQKQSSTAKSRASFIRCVRE